MSEYGQLQYNISDDVFRGGIEMTISFELVEEQALKLTSSERAKLAELLFASLDEDGGEVDGVEAAWAKEVEKRMALLESGEVAGIPFEISNAQEKTPIKFNITPDEQAKRQAAVNTARASVGLEGFQLTPDTEHIAQRFINGEIDFNEFMRVPPMLAQE